MRIVLHSTRVAVALVAAIVLVSHARAEMCTKPSDCTVGEFGGIPVCTKSSIFGITLFFGTCSRPGACNTDTECRNGASCLLGVCQLPANSPGGSSSGSGTGIPGEGRHCIPPDGSKPNSWAQDKNGKPLGACPNGTRCNQNGICVRLET